MVITLGVGGSVAVAAGASVGATVAGATVAGAAGAEVAVAAPPQAARIMLESTTTESKANRLRFTFLLQEIYSFE